MVELELFELGESTVTLLGGDERLLGGLIGRPCLTRSDEGHGDEHNGRRGEQGAERELDAHALDSASRPP